MMQPASTDTKVVHDTADRLGAAIGSGRAIPPLRDVLAADDIELAYAIQQELVRRRIAAGATVVGRKVGLTSLAVQQQLGVDQPDFGVLFDDMDVSDASEVPSPRLIQPKVEAEIAFVLKADLASGEFGHEQLVDAVDYAVAALEIVDSRIRDWDIAIADTIADNASSGLFVLGGKRLAVAAFDLAEITMRMYVDGVEASHGVGRACLGNPLNSLAWLARTARHHGEPLRAGQVVLSGALGPMVAAQPGVTVRAELGPLGVVEARFSTRQEDA